MSLGKSIIIELNEHDANRLLALVQREANKEPSPGVYLVSAQSDADYWAGIANQITAGLEQQKNGQFFQCSACFCQG